MLTTTVQWYSLAGSLIFLLMVLDSVRRQRLREAYALIWIFLAVGMILISLWTDILKFISDILGILYPPATLFLLLLVGILLLLFQYSIVISMHHERILRLTQEIALLKEKLNRTEKTNEPSDQ